MSEQVHKSTQPRDGWVALAILMVLGLLCSSFAFGSDKDKKKDQSAAQKLSRFMDLIDKSKVVWPQPPNIARVKYHGLFRGRKAS